MFLKFLWLEGVCLLQYLINQIETFYCVPKTTSKASKHRSSLLASGVHASVVHNPSINIQSRVQRVLLFTVLHIVVVLIYHICVRSKVGKLEMWIRHLSFSVKRKFLSAKLHLTGHLNHQWSENNTPSFNPESKLLYVDWCNRFGLVWTSLEKEIHGPKTTFKNGEFDCLKTTDPLHSAINPPIDGLRCWLSINGHHSVDAFTVVL